ncbi:hypothetical protein [Peribacillus asahii]|uniref:hypothetical protein n=1 Tax=Peribacillus asahii TaxID=228899 RepID=UPI0037F5D32F
MDKYSSLPIMFEQIGNVLDDRFIKVKIWIAHTGENRNNSIFSKEVLESMIPSLANAPILGYIATNEEGEQDFKGHEEKLVIEGGEFNFKYIGRAWGVIPETNNARFEFRYGEDGIEREYLVTEGVLWKSKFPEVNEIFDRDGGYKSQSMELFPPSVKGFINEQGIFEFTEAKVEGACVLGEGINPAMISSTIEKFSVADNVKTDLSDMLTEFNAYFSTIQKGDDTVEDENKVLEPETQVAEVPNNFEEPTEPATQEGAEPVVEPDTEFTEPTEPTEPETPAEPETDFADGKKDDEEDEEDEKDSAKKDDDDEEDDKKSGKFTVKFELSHDDIRSNLYGALGQHESFQDSWFWISKVYDSYAIVEDEGQGKFFAVNYVKHENAVSIGEFQEVFPLFVNATEKQAIDLARNAYSQYEALETEVKELRAFKSTTETAEKESKLTSYASVLSKDEYKAIQDNLSNFSLTDIEKEIGFILLKKNHFSASSNQPEEDKSRVNAVPVEESFPYGTASKYFTKN